MAGDIGYPVVVKPRAADSPAGLMEAVEFTDASGEWAPGLPTHEQDILVEEFAAGPEVSVDSVVHRRTVTSLCLARKEVGFESCFRGDRAHRRPGRPAVVRRDTWRT
ncbi:hypothetical protein [Streptomyces sp. CC0208]|uniref:ATP-grasp domain-containing protein n=1 Tax=Streptomyces sviceus (strain ATCC 29083 / DSM 924 / JCM 4929 / NBRC 13980 / NCIMB 11184 / NRRL 5439 / UC 5370) TaxID=463191 RepID=D6XBU2_STRX2|nr:hypothetical protein [Streptomyces sp. CC0208]EFH28197.1 conserved hypothetical protein [Streptomyces sviceus ATCC 29083]